MHNNVRTRQFLMMVGLLLILAGTEGGAEVVAFENPKETLNCEIDPRSKTEASVGNITLDQFRQLPGRHALNFDDVNFYKHAAGTSGREYTSKVMPDTVGKIVFTKESELGRDLTIEFKSPGPWWWSIYNQSKVGSTSGKQALLLRPLASQGGAIRIGFSKPVAAVGFILINMKNLPSDRVVFYKDEARGQALATVELSDAKVDENKSSHHIFVGYTSAEGIRVVEFEFREVNGDMSPISSRGFDDLSFCLLPES